MAAPGSAYLYDDIAWVDSLIDPAINFAGFRADTAAPGVVCRTFPRYRVISIDRTGDVGSDVIVRPASSAAGCGADSVAGDFVVRNESAEYFMGMLGDRLYLDSGTGTVRAVIIHDVPTRRKLTSFAGDIAGWRDSTTLVVWIAGQTEQPRSLCPKVPEGFGAVADTLFIHDLVTGNRVTTGRWRCAARE